MGAKAPVPMKAALRRHFSKPRLAGSQRTCNNTVRFLREPSQGEYGLTGGSDEGGRLWGFLGNSRLSEKRGSAGGANSDNSSPFNRARSVKVKENRGRNSRMAHRRARQEPTVRRPGGDPPNPPDRLPDRLPNCRQKHCQETKKRYCSPVRIMYNPLVMTVNLRFTVLNQSTQSLLHLNSNRLRAFANARSGAAWRNSGGRGWTA